MSDQEPITSNVLADRPKSNAAVKAIAIVTTVILLLLLMLVAGSLLPGILFFVLSGLGAPNANILLFLSVLFLASVVTILPILILVWLFSKKRFMAISIFSILCVLALALFGGTYFWRPLELIAGKTGIHLSDAAPSGILTLAEDSIPDGFYLGEKGEVTKSFKGKTYYFKGYYSDESQSQRIIRLMYNMGEQCFEFNRKEYTPANCVSGQCVTRTSSSPVSDGKTNFKSKDITFAIDDNGSCVRLSFLAPNESTALSQDQVINVVNSLKRVPGQLQIPEISDGESSLPTTRSGPSSTTFNEAIMKANHAALEASKIEKGSYKDYVISPSQLTYTDGDCVSTLRLDVSPDGQKYVLHRPICPDMEKSYCVENGQKDVVTSPTTLIQSTYHCK